MTIDKMTKWQLAKWFNDNWQLTKWQNDNWQNDLMTIFVFRALYNDADIYLLDDPLSAVDAEVAKHIFQQ